MRQLRLGVALSLLAVGCRPDADPRSPTGLSEKGPQPRASFLLSGTGFESRITTNPSYQAEPAVSQNRIAYVDDRNGNLDVYWYNTLTGEEFRVTNDAATQGGPAIDGKRIVYMDVRHGDWEIYLYDTGTKTETRITNNSSHQLHPAISGDFIVWEDLRNGLSDIYMYNLADGTETRITTNTASQHSPDIADGDMVWQDNRNGNADIYGYDLGTGTEHPISTHSSGQERPAISGGRVVWADSRNAGGADNNLDIFMWSPERTTAANANGPYTANEGAGISFSSAGSGDGARYFKWTFGDGTISHEANPKKVYRDNGEYTVTLTVTDLQGATATATTTATIANAAPTAAFSAPSALLEGSGYSIGLAGKDAGPADVGSLQYALDCGQGDGYTVYGSTKTLSCPVVPDQATITTKGKVRDKDGAETEYTKVLTVNNARPVASLSAASPTTFSAGGSLSVSGGFTDAGADDDPWSWQIIWGDGTMSTGSAPDQATPIAGNHAYAKAGTYSTFLRVTDKDGRVGDSARITVTVTAPE